MKADPMVATILHLSDLHLLSDPSATVRDVVTNLQVVSVLNHIRSRLDRGDWRVSLAVITGDIAHDEIEPTYQRTRQVLLDLVPELVPVLRIIPGNHDNRAAMKRVYRDVIREELQEDNSPLIVFSESVPTDKSVNWQIIGLDTQCPGELYGQVGDTQRQWLRRQLELHADKPAIILMHHPPFSVGSAKLDEIKLRGAESFLDLLSEYTQVRVVCTGHVHQVHETSLRDTVLISSPSAAIQFQPGCDETRTDPIGPGFRIIRLQGEQFHTEVVRVPNGKASDAAEDSHA